MRFGALDAPEASALEELVDRSPMGNVLAAWDWQEVLRFSGWRPHPVGVWSGPSLQAAGLLSRRRVPLLGTLFDFHGSLLGRDPSALRLLLSEARRIADQGRGLRIRYGIRCPREEMQREFGVGLRELLPAPPDRSLRSETHGTYWVDLRQEDCWGPETWSRHHRRDLRKGEREGVRVRQSHEPGHLEMFRKIWRATYERKGIVREPEGLFDRLGPLVERGRIGLFFAYHGGEPLATAILGRGRVCRYLWGGLLQTGPGTPPTGPLLHLAMMQDAARHRADYYDLGGAPGPDPIPGHPNYGVWRFKNGFRGRHVMFEDEYDLILRPIRERALGRALSSLRSAGGTLRRLRTGTG